MKKFVTSWLIFIAFFFIHIQNVLSEIVCYSISNSFPLCEKDSHELLNYEPKYADYAEDIYTINVTDSDIRAIREYTFNDGNSDSKTKKLILSLSDSNLIIERDAFTKLTRLESLEITRGRVQLNYHIFQKLDFLKFLKLRINERLVRLSRVLQDIPNLESLEILDNDTIGICDSFKGQIIISQLEYKGGNIDRISDGSFKCLTQLKQLRITETHLSVIAASGFDNLNELEMLSITKNQYLSYIPLSYKVNSMNIITLDLSNNSITAIDKNSVIKMAGSNCLLLNLSYNLLDYLTNKSFEHCQCKTIDLSANQIIFIADGVFKNSIAEKILMNENLIGDVEDHLQWDISEMNKIHIDRILYDIAVSKNFYKLECINQKCYSSDNNIFEICKYCEKLLSVTMKSMPARLSPKTLEISDNQLLYIEKRAFSNLFIETLIIESTGEILKLNYKTFDGLSTLKNLVFVTDRVLFNEFDLKTLINLEHLVVSFDLSIAKFFKPLINLKSLITVRHTSSYFCDIVFNYKNTILRYLQYQRGSFTTIPTKSFECLNGLTDLVITEGKLITIDTGAFDGLENLDTLILENNKITSINKNTFIGLLKLKKLSLASNSISFIDDDAFRLQTSNYLPTDCTFDEKNKDFCKPETLSVLDLSCNKLKYLRNNMLNGILIEQIDISNNSINYENNENELEDYQILASDNNLRIFLRKTYEKNIEYWCFNENLFIICAKNQEIFSVTHNDIIFRRQFNIFGPINPLNFVSNLELELSIGHYILSIHPYVFMNMTNNYRIKTLTFQKRKRSEFIFVPEIFAGLENLENLEFNVGPVKLTDRYFDNLNNLKSLIIEVSEDEYYLSEILQYLYLLESLEIFKNASVGICDNPFADSIPPIITLSYTNSNITTLRNKSLNCLTYLENFKVSYTLLSTIETDAFNGLDNLRTINLAYNQIAHIQINIFNYINRLNVIELNDNVIEKIDAGALTMNNKFLHHRLLLVNINNNKLENFDLKTLQGLKCRVLDLSRNEIQLDDFYIPDSCIQKIIFNESYFFDSLIDCQH